MNNRRICAALLTLFLLTGCGPAKTEGTYDEGYSAGYTAGETVGREEAYRSGYEEGLAAGTEQETPPSETEAESWPSSFVQVSEAVPDVILEIRYYSTYNFVGERIDGYDAPVALLTREAAEALKAVSDEMMDRGYRLKIYDAYRPQRAVDFFRAWAQDLERTDMKPCFYPEVPKEKLFDLGYIASKSGHSRGSTVDLTLFDMRTGKEVDMGGTFDYFGAESHSDYRETLTAEQLANRKLLREAMTGHGFRGISTEWWHFTLKEEPFPETYFNFPVTDR